MTLLSNIEPQRTKGRACLVTKYKNGKSRLDIFFQDGAAKIRMPQSFDGRMEAVLINTSGGLTGGDRIEWQAEAGSNTDLTITTQACERVYKSSSGYAEVRTVLKAREGSILHWLPQETILFDQGRLRRTLDVELDDMSEFIGLEAVLVGRKAMGETVRNGEFRDRWRIRRNGVLLHAEDLRLDGEIAALCARKNVLNGNLAFATLLLVSPRAEVLLPKLRSMLADRVGGVSYWNGKLVIRLAEPEGFDLRKILIPIISLLRNGRPPPKVWHI